MSKHCGNIMKHGGLTVTFAVLKREYSNPAGFISVQRIL